MTPNRDKLAAELIALRKKYEPFEARDKEICTLLKQLAGSSGNFEVVVKGEGRIKVSAPKDKAMKGTAPEIVVEAFMALPQRRRDALIEQGVVKVFPQYSGAYYGAVTVELFP
jgi:hypothetical protein